MAWLCLCNGVDDRSIRAAIEDGATDIDDVGRACGAGTNCHGCHGSIDDLLDEHLGYERHGQPGQLIEFPRRAAS